MIKSVAPVRRAQACQINTQIFANSRLKPLRTSRRVSSKKWSGLDDPRVPHLQISQTNIDVCCLPNLSNFHVVFYRPTNFKIRPNGPTVVHVGRFGMSFGAPLSFKIRDLLNLLNCNRYNAEISFLQFQASQFGTPSQSSTHVFQTPFLDLIFQILC